MPFVYYININIIRLEASEGRAGFYKATWLCCYSGPVRVFRAIAAKRMMLFRWSKTKATQLIHNGFVEIHYGGISG